MDSQIERAFQGAVYMFKERERGIHPQVFEEDRARFRALLLYSQLATEPQRQVARDMLDVWDGPSENFWTEAQPIYDRVKGLGVDLKGQLLPGSE